MRCFKMYIRGVHVIRFYFQWSIASYLLAGGFWEMKLEAAINR